MLEIPEFLKTITSLLCPLYFVRNGFIDISNSHIWNSGINQYNWSKIALSQRTDGLFIPSAYFLYFNSTTINSSNGMTYRWAGYPLRCLVEVKPCGHFLGSGGRKHNNDASVHLPDQRKKTQKNLGAMHLDRYYPKYLMQQITTNSCHLHLHTLSCQR